MRPGSEFDQSVLRFRAKTGPELIDTTMNQLKVGRALVDHLVKLSTLVREPGDQVPAAREVLDMADDLLLRLQQVEDLVTQVRNAKSEWSKTLDPVTASKKRTVKLTIAPRKESLAAGLARVPETTAQFEVDPGWWLRPNVGVGLLLSNRSRFKTYEVERT